MSAPYRLYTGDIQIDMAVDRELHHHPIFKRVLRERLCSMFPSMADGSDTDVHHSRLYKELLSPYYNSVREAYELRTMHEYKEYKSDRFPSLRDFWSEAVKEYHLLKTILADRDIAEVLDI
jgi:hypothetical protein